MQVIDRRCAVGINILVLVGGLVGHYIVECAEPGNVSHIYLMIAPCMYQSIMRMAWTAEDQKKQLLLYKMEMTNCGNYSDREPYLFISITLVPIFAAIPPGHRLL